MEEENKKPTSAERQMYKMLDSKLGILAENIKESISNTKKVKLEGIEVLTIKGDKGDKGEKGEKGDDGHSPTPKEVMDALEPNLLNIKSEIVNTLHPFLMKGEDGKMGEKGQIGKNGKDGLNGTDGLNGKDGKDGLNGSQDTAENIVKKLLSLKRQWLSTDYLIGYTTPRIIQEIGGGSSSAAQDTITLTTTGSSGASTLIGNTLNIPQYSGGGMAIGGSITSATVGSVLFAGASGVLAQDNPNFFWDDTNNRLSIGTNAPDKHITLSGGIGTGLSFYNTITPGRADYFLTAGISGYSHNSLALFENYDAVDYYHLTTYGLSLFLGGRNNVSSSSSVTILNDQNKTRSFDVTDNSKTSIFTVLNTGDVSIGATSTSARLHVLGQSISRPVAIFQAPPSHSTSIVEFQNVSGVALSKVKANGNIEVPDEAYGIGWDGSLEVPTKNALYDKIQTLGGGGTVTSVAISGANGIGVASSPITTSGTIALTLGAITPSSVAASGTITGSNLSGTNTGDQTITLTGDITGSGTGSFATAIAAGVIVDADINASAGIGLSKLAALTASRALVSDGSGVISAATTTATEIGYVNGVTSAIQTQLNAKQATGNYITALTGDVTASGPGSSTATIANDAVTYAKMQNVSAASKLLGRGDSGSGDTQEITLGSGLLMTGTTLSVTSGGTGTVTSVSVTTANGVSGSVATATTTPNITLTLGVITPTSVNGITLSGSGSLANSGTSSLTGFTGSGTSSGTNTGDQTNISGNAATVTTNANLTGVITSSGNNTSIASQTGTGTKFVVDTSPTLVTPVLGVATATTINKVTITAPATASTLTIADGKTLTVNRTLTFTGTDSTTMTFPSANAIIARTDAAQTFAGIQTMTSPAQTISVTTGSSSFTAWAGATTLLTIGGTGASASLFAPSTLDATSSITGAIRTSGGISAAKALNIGTTATIGTTIELGHATDTTLSRSAAGVLAVEGVVIPSISSANTITNKRNQPRIVSVASYTTDTGTSLDFATCDLFIVTAQAGALKFNNPSGTPVHGEKIIIRVEDNGTARALTYDTQYRAVGVTLPTTTVISKTVYLGGIWNATDTKLDIIAVAQEA